MKTAIITLILSALSLAAFGAQNTSIRLPNGEPLVGIYYFTHWWEPWKSSDDAILKDLKRLQSMGFNTIFLDHEWSQMIDGNWRLLDRAHKLAKEADMRILPWLSLKTWGDIGGNSNRRNLIKEQYGVTLRTGVDANGRDNNIVLPYDEGTIVAGADYARQYLKRYAGNGALLYVDWNGKPRPVVALTVELAWKGSCDDTTQLMFRLWLRGRYATIKDLNDVWKTQFTGFDEIDLCDSSVFDLEAHTAGNAGHPKAVEDQVEFRAQVIDSSLSTMSDRVREDWPDVLIATELPYQIECEHPHGKGYRIGYGANPSATEHADILTIRATGLLSDAEQKAHLKFKERTGKKTILAYRTYQDWGPDILSGKMKPQDIGLYPSQAAKLAEGFAFYSFNEMVDTHVAPDPNPPFNSKNRRIKPEESEAAISALGEMAKQYRSLTP